MWKNTRKQHKILAPTWSDEFELPDVPYYVSDIQDYAEYIIRQHELLTTFLPIHVHINRINTRLVFEIKHYLGQLKCRGKRRINTKTSGTP